VVCWNVSRTTGSWDGRLFSPSRVSQRSRRAATDACCNSTQGWCPPYLVGRDPLDLGSCAERCPGSSPGAATGKRISAFVQSTLAACRSSNSVASIIFRNEPFGENVEGFSHFGDKSCAVERAVQTHYFEDSALCIVAAKATRPSTWEVDQVPYRAFVSRIGPFPNIVCMQHVATAGRPLVTASR
jgi:hypothetical protein